jgi:ABC-2 type transport system permease protein
MAPVVSIKFGFANLWMFMLIPFLASLVMAILGLYFNLLFPKLEWESEVQPVKQGLSTMVTLFFGFAFVILPFVFYFAFFVTLVNYVLFGLLLVAYFVLWIVFSYTLLHKSGKTHFERL